MSGATFRTIIALWPEPGAVSLAGDLGVLPGMVKQWHRRDSIPGDRFAEIAAAARRRGLADVTVERLAEIARRRRLAVAVPAQAAAQSSGADAAADPAEPGAAPDAGPCPHCAGQAA